VTERDRPPAAPPEASTLLAAGADERYEHLVERTVADRVLYMWGGASGAILLADPTGHEAVPIWPHPWYAEDYCRHFDPGVLDPDDRVIAVDVYDWCASWLGQLIQDGIHVAAFPVADGPCALLEARQFATDVLKVRDREYGCLRCDAELELGLGSSRIADALAALEQAGIPVPE
jgi:hypothetical protein